MIDKYLALAYRRTVLGEQVDPDSVLQATEEYRAALEGELARIKKLGLGASLASRDFVSYQNKRAVEAALAKLAEKTDATG